LPDVASTFYGFTGSSLSGVANLSFQKLFLHAEQGDAIALAIRCRCLDVWAANAVALAHAYDPEILIIGGGHE
jgi:glucokinase